jgi:hypothetical protein
MEEPQEPLDDDGRGDDERETYRLEPEEEENVRADLDDLRGMRDVFAGQGVKGVVITCPDCGEDHFYEWDLLRENLEHMLETGEPRMHEPAFEVREEEYIRWDYGKGYVDALADTGLQPENHLELSACPWCQTPADASFRFCPRCGRSLAALHLYGELVERGLDEREVRAILVRAGFEPF